ncbi:MAG: response regulator [Candidatus Hatepunaea meridiana]|nr:response regulator [Candidatus Hatepunaea meridiana]
MDNLSQCCEKKILICDDEPESPAVIKVIDNLRNSGCLVDIAEDLFVAHQSLDKMIKENIIYDFIVLDLKGKDHNDPYEFEHVFDYIPRIENPPKVLAMSAYLGDLTKPQMKNLNKECEKIYSKNQTDEVISYIVNTKDNDKSAQKKNKSKVKENLKQGGVVSNSINKEKPRNQIDFKIPLTNEEHVTLLIPRPVSWIITVFALLLLFASITNAYKLGRLTKEIESDRIHRTQILTQMTQSIESDRKLRSVEVSKLLQALDSDRNERTLVLSSMRDLLDAAHQISVDIKQRNLKLLDEIKLMRQDLKRLLGESK